MTIVNALKKLVTAWGGSTTAETIAEAIDDLSEVTPSSLPEVSASDNGDVLTVVEGAWAKATPSGGRDFLINLDSITQTVSILEGTYDGLYAKLSQGVPVFGSVVSASEGTTRYHSEVGVDISFDETPATIWINLKISGSDVSLVWASDDTISIYQPQ